MFFGPACLQGAKRRKDLAGGVVAHLGEVPAPCVTSPRALTAECFKHTSYLLMAVQVFLTSDINYLKLKKKQHTTTN